MIAERCAAHVERAAPAPGAGAVRDRWQGVETEHRLRGPPGAVGDPLDRIPPDVGQRAHRPRQAVGLVRPAAMRVRGQERGVGLDEQLAVGHERRRRAQLRRVPERDRARRTTARNRRRRRSGPSRRPRRSSGRPPPGARPPRPGRAGRRRARPGRGSSAACRGAWRGRCASGRRAPARPRWRSAVPVVVEPGLADGDHPRVGGQPLDLGVVGVGDRRRAGGVQGDGGGDPVVPVRGVDDPAGARRGRRRR